MNAIGGGAIKRVQSASRIGERPHAATAARAVYLDTGAFFLTEGLAVVLGVGDPDAAVGFALHAGRASMPQHVHISLLVGRDRAAAVEAISGLDDVALRLESR